MKSTHSSLEISHYPVMLKEVVEACSLQKGGSYVDCTFGGGGYTKEILKISNTKVIALDRDSHVKVRADELSKKYKNRFIFYNKKFSELDKVLSKDDKADAIIFDLGLSSFQLKDMARGFSFKSKQKIDMSMGLTNLSAEKILNNCDEHYLKLILKILGDEKEASKIVKNIVQTRKLRKISTVLDLVEIIKKSKKKDYSKKIDICTKTFQALRIFVNKETTELIEGIIKATKFIKTGGKIIVVSFHSIEDKIVKFYFSNYSNDKSRPSRYLPEETKDKKIFFHDYKNKLLKPSFEEVEINPSSRSAKLRFATRNNFEFREPKSFRIKFKKYLDLESVNVK